MEIQTKERKGRQNVLVFYSSRHFGVPICSFIWQRLLLNELRLRLLEIDFWKMGKRETKSNERKNVITDQHVMPSCRCGTQFELGSSMIFMPFLVVCYRAMLTVVTTIVCLICYCCHRKIKMRASTSSLYRQQRWMDTDPSMEIYSVEQVSRWKFSLSDIKLMLRLFNTPCHLSAVHSWALLV